MSKQLIATALALTLVVLPQAGHAYIGPGLGAGAIAAVLGTVAAIFMAFVALLWYPMKRMLRKRTKPALQDEA